MASYKIIDRTQRKSRIFRTDAIQLTVKFEDLPTQQLTPNQLLERLRRHFEELLDDVLRDSTENTRVRMALQSPQLAREIYVPFHPAEEMTADLILEEIEKVIQSNENFTLDEEVQVKFIITELPGGGYEMKKEDQLQLDSLRISNFPLWLKKKRSIITIKNNDDLCMARALMTAKAHVDEDPKYPDMRDGRKLQRTRAVYLHQAANIEPVSYTHLTLPTKA